MRKYCIGLAALALVTLTAIADDATKKKPTGQSLKVHRQATTISKTTKPLSVVCTSAEEVKKHLGDDLDKLTTLKLSDIDFSDQMVIIARNGQTNAFGVNLKILSAIVEKKGEKATVTWEFKPYFGGAAPPNEPGNPTLVAVLEKFPGKVVLKKKVWTWPKGSPLPPSAPPSLPPSRPGKRK